MHGLWHFQHRLEEYFSISRGAPATRSGRHPRGVNAKAKLHIRGFSFAYEVQASKAGTEVTALTPYTKAKRRQCPIAPSRSVVYVRILPDMCKCPCGSCRRTPSYACSHHPVKKNFLATRCTHDHRRGSTMPMLSHVHQLFHADTCHASFRALRLRHRRYHCLSSCTNA